MISCALVEIFLNFHFKQLTFPGLHEIVSDPDPPLGMKLSIRQLEKSCIHSCHMQKKQHQVGSCSVFICIEVVCRAKFHASLVVQWAIPPTRGQGMVAFHLTS